MVIESRSELTSVRVRSDLAARLVPLAIVLAVAIGLSAPLAWIVVGMRAVRDRAQAVADQAALSLRTEARERPMWRYDTIKLVRSLSSSAAAPNVARLELVDPGGRRIDLGLPAAEQDPGLWVSAPIELRGETIAEVWVGASTEELERDGAQLLIAFAILGSLLGALVYAVPMRAVERSLQLSAALAEVRDKEHRLREASGREVAAQEAERRALARELHDSAGQALTGLRIQLQLLAAQPERVHELCGRSLRLADEIIEEIRRVVDRLAPAILADMGLSLALERQIDSFEERTGIAVTGNVQPDLRVSGEVETACYRIVQESLTNVARHAETQQVEVSVSVVGEALQIRVSDHGRGLAPGQQVDGKSRGLIGMRERTELLGGTFELRTPSGGGTEVRVTLPFGPELG